jgi:hypothetical protein
LLHERVRKMFDWLTSRTAVIIACIVILGVMFGFFGYRMTINQEQSLNDVSDLISQEINDVTSKDASFKVRFTFSQDSEGYELPPTVNGDSYDIRIEPYQVVVDQDGKRAISPILNGVHLFYPPLTDTLSLSDVYRADLLVDNFTLRSGEDFYLENKMYMMPGEAHLTFVYTGYVPASLGDLQDMAEAISDFNEYDLTDPSVLNDSLVIPVNSELRLGENVLVANGSLVAFTIIEHLWEPPPDFNTTESYVNTTDLLNRKLFISSGEDLIIERRYMRFTDVLVDEGVFLEGVEVFAYSGGST